MLSFKDCKKAELYNDHDDLLCTAEVDGHLPSYLSMLVPETFNYRAQNSFRTVFFYPKAGLVTCRCRLFNPVPEQGGNVNLRFEVLQEISQVDRRMDLKIPISSFAMIHVIRPILEQGMDPAEGYPALLNNISAGGVHLQAKVLLTVGQRITFHFVETGQPLPLTAEILRVEHPDPNAEKQLYGYGCRFIRLSSQHESMLRNYIFQQDRQRRD